MKLKQYLYEFQQDVDTDKSRVKPIENTEAFKILETRCERAFAEYTETGRHIQRYATGRKPDFGTMDASKMPPRLSRNTLNYYTLIINDDPIWKKYPRRQVIGSYRSDGTKMEDPSVYIIFPYNTTSVGVCPTDDMWDAFYNIKTQFGARRFNDVIKRLLNGGGHGPTWDSSLPEFKKACKAFDKKVKDSGGEYLEEMEYELESHGNTKTVKVLQQQYKNNLYKDVVLYAYNPKGFRVGMGGMVPGKNMNEVWFEGPAVFANSAFIDMHIGTKAKGPFDD